MAHVSYFPIKYKTISLKRLNSPWVTDDVLKCIQKKHQLYCMNRDGIIPKNNYVKFKNVLNSTLKKLKSAYFQRAFINAKQDLSKTWRILSDLSKNSQKGTNDIITALNVPDTDRSTEDQIEIANIFKDHFATGPLNLVNTLPIIVPSHNYDNLPSNQSSIFLSPSKPNEIKNILKAFTNKSTGLKDIPMKVLKSLPLL